MDIYFCDECAARVTAADLRRGFGIKKSDVVVCGSCVEEGRGAERLEKAGVASAAAQPAQALVGAGVLDERRDRAETAPEDDGGAETAPAEDYFDNVHPEDDTDPINQSLDKPNDGPSDSAGFGAMASGMSALSEGSEQVADDVDDLEDSGVDSSTGTDELDPQPAAAGELDDMLGDATAATGEAEQPEAEQPEAVDEPDEVELASEAPAEDEATDADEADAKAADPDSEDELSPTDLALDENGDDGTVGKAETEEVPAASASSVADAPGRKRGSTTKRKGSGRSKNSTSSKSGTSSRRKSSSGSRPGSKTTKRGSTRTSTKRVGAVKKGNAALIYGVSAVTIGILLTAIIIMAVKGPPEKRGPVEIDVGKELATEVHQTLAFAKEAYAENDVGKLGQAIDRIDRINSTELDSFIEQAESQGLSEDEMDRSLRSMKFYDLRAMRRTLSDKKLQLEAQQGD